MIINELKENTIDIYTDITSVAYPKLSMRDNNYVVPYGGALVLNYYVCDHSGIEYQNDDGSLSVGRKTPNTFTFIARIDEDILDLDEVQEFKQTTLAGEQTMEIDVSSFDPGRHSVIVQCISNGCSSPVTWLKFRIENENEDQELENNTLDLSSFSVGDSFESEFVGFEDSYINPDTGNSNSIIRNASTKCVKSNDFIDASSTFQIAERTIVAKYKVTLKSNNEIQIDVSRDQSDAIQNNDITYTYINNWTGYYRKRSANATLAKVDAYSNLFKYTTVREDITGTYTLSNVISENGSDYILSEHIDDAPTSVPLAARIAAANNNIAFTRLLEAVLAYFFGNSRTQNEKCRLILPHGMTIVFDYYGLKSVKTDYVVNVDRTKTSSDETDRVRTRMKFPDQFVLDLNESTLCVMQANSSIKSGPFVAIDTCYDTHIVNGTIRGTYKGKNYALTGLSESLNNMVIIGGEFCSFDNILDLYSTGYDAECIGRDKLIWEERYHTSEQINRVIFNKPGYIDFDGRIHNINTIQCYNEEDESSPILIPVTDDILLPRYTYGIKGSATDGRSYDSTLRKIRTSDGLSPTYRGRKSIKSGIEYMCGGYITLANPGAKLGETSFATAAGLYIYFYKPFDPSSNVYQEYLDDIAQHSNIEGYEPDFEPLEFVKAYKVLPNTPILVPKGAMYAHLCAVGTYTVNKWRGLIQDDSSTSFARFHFWEYQASWASGFNNCCFSYGRTSILNWHYCYQCYVRDCHSYRIGDGREVNFGGMSNQSYNIDTEDNSAACGNMAINSLDCISGKHEARFHHPINVCWTNIRGYYLNIEKNVFMGTLKNSYISIKNTIGYSHPIKYINWVNNVFTGLTLSYDGLGNCNGKMLIENCSVIKYTNSIGTETFSIQNDVNTGKLEI